MTTEIPAKKSNKTLIVIIVIVLIVCVVLPLCLFCMLSILGPVIADVFFQCDQRIEPVASGAQDLPLAGTPRLLQGLSTATPTYPPGPLPYRQVAATPPSP